MGEIWDAQINRPWLVTGQLFWVIQYYAKHIYRPEDTKLTLLLHL